MSLNQVSQSRSTFTEDKSSQLQGPLLMDSARSKDSGSILRRTKTMAVSRADNTKLFGGINIEENKQFEKLEEYIQQKIKLTFQEQREQFLKDFTKEVPESMTQVEDTIYYDQKRVITLQYQYYQKGLKTTKLTKTNSKINLGTENYRSGKSSNTVNIFQEQGTNYIDSVLTSQENKESGNFMEVQNDEESINAVKKAMKEKGIFSKQECDAKIEEIKNDYALLNGRLQTWRVDEKARMQQLKDYNFTLNLPFMPTKKGIMQMKVTRDKQTLSLMYFNPNLQLFESKCGIDYQIKEHPRFKIVSWNISKSSNSGLDIKNQKVHQLLGKSMNEYFINQGYNTQKFNKLKIIDSQFVSSGKYFLLKYKIGKKNEQERRTRAERLSINEIHQHEDEANQQLYYVIWNVQTGQTILEFGGDHTLQVKPQSFKKTAQLYTLGLLIQDTPISNKEKTTENNIAIFYGGGGEQNFKEGINEDSDGLMRDWVMQYVTISLDHLTEQLNNKQDINQYIDEQIRNQYLQINENKCQFFSIDRRWIKFQVSDWWNCIEVATNRDFKYITLTIMPRKPDQKNERWFIVYQAGQITPSNNEFPLIYKKSVSKDMIIYHGRNFQIKRQIYFIEEKQGFKCSCLEFDQKDSKQPLINEIQVELSDATIDKIDVIIHDQKRDKYHDRDREEFNNMNKKHIQAISVEPKQKCMILKTKIPLHQQSRKGQDYQYIYKKSSQCIQNEGSYPILVRNIGVNKLSICNVNDTEEPKQYLLELDQNEIFLTFAKFNSYKDIGFFPEYLRISCCSCFVFLTLIGDSKDTVQMNLLLVDPFYKNIQIALFKSSHIIDYPDFNEYDVINACYISPLKESIQESSEDGQHLSEKELIYVITQYQATINRSVFIKNRDIKFDILSTFNEEQSFFDDESDDDSKPSVENVLMIQDKNSYLYYITKTQGQCSIMEINPRESQLRNHKEIVTFKAEYCLAFDTNGQEFFVMDEFKTVTIFQRKSNHRYLEEVGEVNVSKFDAHEITQQDFKRICLNEKYFIYDSKIYYLYGDEQYPEGILDQEQLIDEDQQVEQILMIKGPIMLRGSDLFANTYKIGAFKFCTRVYILPDSQKHALINDFQQKVEFSTFLDDGEILVKCENRFLIFTDKGDFLDEAQFKHDLKTQISDGIANLLLQNWMNVICKDSSENQEEQEQKEVCNKDQLNFAEKTKTAIDGSSPESAKQQHHKDDLVQLSYRNNYFLFFNRLQKTFTMYQLCKKQYHKTICQIPLMKQYLKNLKIKSKCSYSLKYVYTLDFQDSIIYKDILGAKFKKHSLFDLVDLLLNDALSVTVEDNSDVRMACIKIPDKDEEVVENKIEQQILMSFFSKDQPQQSYANKFEIDSYVKDNLFAIYDTQIKRFREQLATAIYNQFKLESHLQDLSQIQYLKQNIKYYEMKQEKYLSAKIYTNILFVWVGKQIQYAYINTNNNSYEISDFKIAKINFDNTVEIKAIINTNNYDTYQIVARDYEESIQTVLLWNFTKDIEFSLFQQQLNLNQVHTVNVIKGMNRKMNYFRDEIYVYDLQSNVPTQNLPLCCLAQRSQKDYPYRVLDKLQNQKKIYKNNTRNLDLVNPHILNFCNSRMDLTLWKDIEENGKNNIDCFENIPLKDYNKFYNGQSLFHRYAAHSDVITLVHDKFSHARSNKQLNMSTLNLPLICLCPDFECHTALYYCIENENIKSFEQLICMIDDFSGLCLSSQLIKYIPMMLNRQSQIILDFFDDASYKPLSMEKILIIPCNTELPNEIVFPCNTSLITSEFVLEKFEELNLIKAEKQMIKKQHANTTNENQQKQKIKVLQSIQNICHNADQDKVKNIIKKLETISLKEIKRQAVLRNKSNQPKSTHLQIDKVDFYSLNRENQGEESIPLMRLNVETLEFNWIFEEGNALNLIKLLASLENNAVLTKKSIKMFIKFMWKDYQIAILKKLFLPYICYLLQTIYLSSTVLTYIQEAMQQEERDMEFHYFHALMICLGSCITGYFAFLEWEQFIEQVDYIAHFSDVWNYLDLISLILNYIMIIQMTVAVVFNGEDDKIFMEVQLIRRIGSFTVFFIMIKVFYWMRLFESSAKYVRLIIQTITDILVFIILVAVVTLAFSSFFFIINKNYAPSEDDPDTAVSYTLEYSGNEFFDAVISVYLLTNGYFDLSRYGFMTDNNDSQYLWVMFIFAVYMNTVVFLNMVIAIMGDTYSKVMECQEESGLQEMIGLMYDNLWVLDVDQLFQSSKYLIKISQVTQEEEEEQDTQEQIQQLGGDVKYLIKKMDNHSKQFMKQMNEIDNQFKQFYTMQVKSKSQLQKIDEQIKAQDQVAKLAENNIEQLKLLQSVFSVNEKIGSNLPPLSPFKKGLKS